MKKSIIKNITIDDLFQKLNSNENHVSYLTGFGQDPWQQFLGFNPSSNFIFKRKNKEQIPLKEIETFIKTHQTAKDKIIGYFSYDLGYELHKINQKTKKDLDLPDIYLLAYQDFVVQKGKDLILNYKNKTFPQKIKQILERSNKETNQNYKNKNLQTIITPQQYQEKYEKIKAYIKAGDIYQINLTHRLEGKTQMPARKLFTKILEANPVEYLAYIEGDDFEILSASPEKFVKIKKRKIETRPIKGTRPRGKTPTQDHENQIELFNSQKEASELNMITDLLRNDLGKIAKIGSVKVHKFLNKIDNKQSTRALLQCPTVWHTYSKITAQIDESHSNLQVIISMLPGGSITGCPKKRAMEIIDELELTTRGIYTGIIGYIDPDDTYEFNIAIRTIIKNGENLYLQVGGGIVLDSNQKDEFQETLNKAASFMKILE